eukprot:GCRY01001277.1.p1 GENE.GCRY01001277.1~~GCRY01001277.1.p1  ORF type:complete len:252 (-),score=11.75 GCRY01001277.1:14-769(-)
MLPFRQADVGRSFGPGETDGKISEYLKRAFNYTQMDLEYTFWQMQHLLYEPSRVYKTTSYRKQTKNQWARDDPAFVLILSCFVVVSTLAHLIALHAGGLLSKFMVVFFYVFLDFFLLGGIISTFCWWISNTYLLRSHTSTHSVKQKVEWLYCFDIHCNSYFPYFMITHVLEYFLLPLLTSSRFFSAFLGNILHFVGVLYYLYITFLGFSALHFLEKTKIFLYPMAPTALLYLFLTLSNVNIVNAINALKYS